MSSGIRGTYDAETQVLTVTFRNGTYRLPNVPANIAAGFAASSSKGAYWNANLKGRY
jgi:hypothetical protein